MSTNHDLGGHELAEKVRSFGRELPINVPPVRALEGRVRDRRARRRRRTGLATALVIAVVAAGSLSIAGREPTRSHDTPVHEVAQAFQQVASFDYDPLADQAKTLNDIAAASVVVGRGTIVDVQLGYALRHGVFSDGTVDADRNLLLVIEPTEFVKGDDQLGSSGRVFVSHPWSDAYDLDAFRQVVSTMAGEVVFYLTPVVFDASQTVVDEYAGRAEDDPVFWPTHPSALLAVDSETTTALPILTDEQIEPSSANREALAATGARVDGFAAADIEVHGVPDPANADEG